MSDAVQCNRCESKHDPNEFITRVALSSRRAVDGIPKNPLEYDFCEGCLKKVRLILAEGQWPEVKGME